MNKSRSIHVKLTPRERLALELLAKDDGLKMSEVARNLIRRTAKQRGVWDRTIMAGNQQARHA